MYRAASAGSKCGCCAARCRANAALTPPAATPFSQREATSVPERACCDRRPMGDRRSRVQAEDREERATRLRVCW